MQIIFLIKLRIFLHFRLESTQLMNLYTFWTYLTHNTSTILNLYILFTSIDIIFILFNIKYR